MLVVVSNQQTNYIEGKITQIRLVNYEGIFSFPIDLSFLNGSKAEGPSNKARTLTAHIAGPSASLLCNCDVITGKVYYRLQGKFTCTGLAETLPPPPVRTALHLTYLPNRSDRHTQPMLVPRSTQVLKIFHKTLFLSSSSVGHLF
jgi:hypothetical protein